MARTQTFQAFWVDADGNDLAQVDAAERGAGNIEANTNAELKLGGSLTVRDVPEWVRPLQHRVRLQATVDEDVIPLGVFMLEEQSVVSAKRSERTSLTLLDQLSILRDDKLTGPLAVGAGANPVALVKQYVERLGESRIAYTPSSTVLATPLVWEPGTTWLRVVNDLLSAANYWGIRTNRLGEFVIAPYVLPEYRPVSQEFVAGEDSLLVAERTTTTNWAGIPNRFVAYAAEYGNDPDDEDEGDSPKPFEGLIGVAENTNADSPFSFQSRGRWVTVAESVEAEDQKTIDNIAARKLADLTVPTSDVSVQHALVPDVWTDRVVRVVPSHGEPFTASVTSWRMSLDSKALVSAQWRKVVSLQ